jgi:tRNA threonylcarbamoyladenosine biosynthesis protein TsaB
MTSALVAVDTATETLSIGLRGRDGRRRLFNGSGGAAASATMLPQLMSMLAAQDLRPADLAAVAFGCGPGAFTGLRTACAVAQGLAFAHGLPVLPVDSLQVVAADAWAQVGRPAAAEIGVAVDARMGQLYAARYRVDDGCWQVMSAPALIDPPGLIAHWRCGDRDLPSLAAGNGLRLLGDTLPPGLRSVESEADRAAAVLELAEAAFDGGAGIDAALALPTYLRDKVALTTAEREQRAAIPAAAATAAVTGWVQRPLTAADIDAVVAVEQGAYSHPWSRGNFVDSLAAGHLALGRWQGDALIAYLIAQAGADEVHLLNLTVARAHLRRGHARQLIGELLAWGRERGAQRVLLEVRQSNAGAQALYRAAGFSTDGLRRRYYPAGGGQREDAVLMSRDIAAAEAVHAAR